MRFVVITFLLLMVAVPPGFVTGDHITGLTIAGKTAFNSPKILPPIFSQQKPAISDESAIRQSDWYNQAIKGIEESEYYISATGKPGVYSAPNRKQNLDASYSADTYTLQPQHDAEWNLQLQLKGIYAGNKIVYSPAPDAITEQNSNTIRFHHKQFTVEYVNKPEGVRQNFIIHQKPAVISSELSVQLLVNDGWHINKVHDKEIHFAKAKDNQLDKEVTYNDLKVWDAASKELEASFTVKENIVSIDVNTANAVFPITIDPLSSTASWTAESNQAASFFGASVASAGDVNGDGYSDVVVGAWLYTNGQTNEGRAFVYHGSATGLSLTPAWTAESNQVVAFFANSVSSAGDVNGDGYSDVIIGSYQYDNGQSNEGGAFLYYGSSTGLVATPAWITESDQNEAWYGQEVACAGDVNGDGYSDVMVGAPVFNGGGPGQGKVFLYFGSASGPSTTPSWTMVGDQDFAQFGGYSGPTGGSLASAGDVNGDGYSDIIIGARAYENGLTHEGKAFVYLGSATGPAAAPVWTAEGNQAYAEFGNSVACAGDVNGDGFSDIIIGARLYDNGQTDEGKAFVYLGSAAGPAASPVWTTEGNQASAFYAEIVASAGDINGDGYSDVLVATNAYDNGQTDEGRLYAYFGSASGLPASPNWTVESNIANSGFGSDLASAGDVNGDGYSDVIAGASNFTNDQTNEGRVFLYNGSAATVSTNPNMTIDDAVQVNANLGTSLACAGDINSDGYSDVIIGVPGIGTGCAFVYYGSIVGLLGSPDLVLTGPQPGRFGASVGAAGDVNGDGYSDVIVGAPEVNDGGNVNEGAAYVYYGSAAGLSNSPDAILDDADQANAFFGEVARTAGDVNSDGYSDVIVGADSYDDGANTDEGVAFVYYGSAAGLSASPDAILDDADQPNASFGASVGTAGDVNGDGFSDVIVGAPLYNPTVSSDGKIYIYFGSFNGLPATPSVTRDGPGQLGVNFGTTVASAGDINGDGFCDIIVGASGLDIGANTNEGRIFIWRGGPTGLGTIMPTQTFDDANASNAFYGAHVASAGDINGDGYSDVMIGAPGINRVYFMLGSPAGLVSAPSFFNSAPQVSSSFGQYLSSGGDINGDGFSDVIVGAPNFDVSFPSSSNEGRAYLYYGNATMGIRNNLRLYNYDLVTPIQQFSMNLALFGAGLYAKSPLGRQKGKLVWETVKNGNNFTGNPITNSTYFLSQQATLTDLGLTGTELKNQVAKEFNARATYIRTRVKYDLATAITGQVYGPWRYPESFLRGYRNLGGVALPVKFVSFIAVKQNESALLKWITTDETASTVYEVQHSVDGNHFTTIKTVSSQNTPHSEYEWLHIHPAPGKNYYRIRAVENNIETFTAIRQLQFGKDIRVLAYPNPVKSGSALTLLLNTAAGEPLLIELFNASGQKITAYTASPVNNSITINLPLLSPGKYLLKVITRQASAYSTGFMIIK